MAFKPERLKWSKKEKKDTILIFTESFEPGKQLTFVSMNNKPYDWAVLVSNGRKVKCISHQVAGLLDLMESEGILRGTKFSSPPLLVKELQALLGYTEPFQLEVIGVNGKTD